MSQAEQAKRLITIDISPATETHCGDCPCADPLLEKCHAFNKDQEWNEEGDFLRLPECIAAEKGTGQC